MPRGRKAKSTTSSRNTTTNKVSVQGSKQAVDNMKYEIANEFGVSLGASATAQQNGRVGGEMTKRLVQRGLNKNNSKSRSK